jgi:hypothetical protein
MIIDNDNALKVIAVYDLHFELQDMIRAQEREFVLIFIYLLAAAIGVPNLIEFLPCEPP